MRRTFLLNHVLQSDLKEKETAILIIMKKTLQQIYAKVSPNFLNSCFEVV